MAKFIVIALLVLLPSESFSQISPVLKKKKILSESLSKTSLSIKRNFQSFTILAIRVDFQQDDNPLTSGDGKFDFTSGSGATVDPPPHDRQYFLDHLEALKRYYNRVSNENVDIAYNLFPQEDRGSYTLPNDIAYYNPNTTEEELDTRLSELLQSSIELADNDPAVDFSLYNAIIVFHAGVGSDFALEEAVLDPTPHDLPSVFLDLSHLRKTIGNNSPDYQGIAVEGGSIHIQKAVILPETESKRGVEIGLFGMTAHQFGHFLGLPSLFNTVIGRPAIGKWGLMGVGFSNFNGVIPPEPSAWSKVFLGWETPVEINTGVNIEVVPSLSETGTKIYKISITPTEYFLLENRQQDFAGDGLNVTLGQSGVILEVDDYDADIPGSGILIWHIDEKVIAAGLDDNTVNANSERKGVDLEEADGSQDIGEDFPGLIPGFLSPENGLAFDAFYSGNNSEFSPSAVPNSFSNSRANSHISITNISEIGNSMSFSVQRDWYIEDFPVYLGGNFTDMAPMWLNPGTSNEIKIIIPSNNGSVFALNGMNKPFVDNGSTALLSGVFGEVASVPVPLFIKTSNSIVAMPSLQTSNIVPDNLRNKLVIATGDPGIEVYSLRDEDNDNFGDMVASWTVQSQISSPVLVSNFIITGGDDGSINFYRGDGQVEFSSFIGNSGITGLAGTAPSSNMFQTLAVSGIGEYYFISGNAIQLSGNTGINNPFLPLFSDLDSDGENEFVVIGADGKAFILNDVIREVKFEVKFSGSPVAGDITGDGDRELVAVSGNKLYSFSHIGVLTTGFPVDLDFLDYGGTITTGLVLGDITGNFRQEILFGTSEGNVFAIDYRGNVIQGFPLPVGASAVGSLTLMKNTGADRLELAALDESGYLYAWDLETTYSDKEIAWETTGGGNARLRGNAETVALRAVPPPNSLMPAERVFNWPNPNSGNWTNIRYFLYADAQVKIRIYSQVGDLVANLVGPGIAHVDNEVTWNLGGIESGIYLAEISASSNGITDKKVIKIAVIK